MNYIEVEIRISGDLDQGRDITIAELSQGAYESFVETEDGLQAYIIESDYDPEYLRKLSIFKNKNFNGSTFDFKLIPEKNWNQEWESNFEAVEVEDFCYLRSTFHLTSPGHLYEVIIDPKMSFGTGHHATTWLMIRQMKDIDFDNIKALDMGCGTGVLAILASMMGAKEVDAVDIDEWAYTNAIENLSLNRINNCKLVLGDINSVPGSNYDIILANITRNILTEDMPGYARLLNKGGKLLLSGFFSEDIAILKERAAELGFIYQNKMTRNNWASIIFNYKA